MPHTLTIKEKHLALSLVTVILLGFACYCCISTLRSRHGIPESGILVRVLLATAPAGKTIEFTVDGPYKVFSGSRMIPYDASGSLFYGYRLGKGKAAREGSSGLTLNGNAIHASSMMIMPKEQGSLKFGLREYAGAFQVLAGSSGELLLLNALDLEDYLAGVLFKEMPSSFPDEALKAQVVAARTYALFRMQSGTSWLTDDARSQMYGGLSAVTDRALELVEATRGEVLTYEDKIIPSYYNSTCGGITARAEDVFQGEAPPPLNHNRTCGFCTDSPYYSWSVSFTLDEIRERLELSPDLRSFEIGVTDADTGRRAREVAILDGRGGIIKAWPAKTFRAALNRGRSMGQSLLSTWIDRISRQGNAFRIEGRGWGHGVGLCQYGARGLALKGKTCPEILEFYYKGAKISPDYGGLLPARDS